MVEKIRKIPLIYVIPILSLIMSFLLVSPFGEFAVNDDWDFYTHVRNFRQGDFIKNSLIDSSFILQGLIGTVWSFVFGFSYVSLRSLTLIVSIIFVIGIVKLLKLLEVPPFLSVIASLTIIFNPFILLSSVTFMTEMYFLCLAIWGIYFLLKYEKSEESNDLILCFILCSLSIMVRQLGLLLFPAICLGTFLIDYKRHKFRTKAYLLGLITFLLAALIVFLWPQYSNGISGSRGFIALVMTSLKNLPQLPQYLFYALPYIGFTLLPLGIWLFSKQKIIIKILIILSSLLLFNSFYTADIFKYGNVLFPEGLMIKNNFIHHITIFDNLLFKSLLCFFINLSFFSFIFALFKKIKIFKLNSFQILSIIFLFFLPVVLYDTFYDRYLVNALVIAVIMAVLLLKDDLESKSVSKTVTVAAVVLTTTLFCLYNFMLLQDFIVTTKTQWNQAAALKSSRDVGNTTFLSSTYTRYTSVFFRKNSENIKTAMPSGISFKCYVQKDVEEGIYKPFYKFLYKLDVSRKLNSYIPNPRIFEETTLPGFRQPTHDTSKIIFKEKIFSLMEYLTGNDVYVVTYCNN
jgi:hypothetical protein